MSAVRFQKRPRYAKPPTETTSRLAKLSLEADTELYTDQEVLLDASDEEASEDEDGQTLSRGSSSSESPTPRSPESSLERRVHVLERLLIKETHARRQLEGEIAVLEYDFECFKAEVAAPVETNLNYDADDDRSCPSTPAPKGRLDEDDDMMFRENPFQNDTATVGLKRKASYDCPPLLRLTVSEPTPVPREAFLMRPFIVSPCPTRESAFQPLTRCKSDTGGL
ncbi:hypothetical protein CYLTODRAFT_443394 [Cylindrobasidium torrendii FP15055 ss-10]|uniref:Uncharacterized protein n=1 Tax=Cylindrobasidium torrendii FP15055 ss-10 TaxID=1314674 RepID=A0A0D7BFF1_9AGAR|nr:hypothetical protein CYLTODRAFT_443394 [Cylindrobasidium torrendii FP15055 ss-10]